MMIYGESDVIKPIVELNNQSVETSSETRERVSRLLKPGQPIPELLFNDANTMYESIRRGSDVSKNGDCLGYRKLMPDGKMPYVWIKYEDVIRSCTNISRAYLEKGLAIGQQTLVAIYSTNRPEWIIAEHACYNYSMISVPLYDTLGLDACSFILKQTDVKLLCVDKSSKAETLLSKRSEFPNLTLLVMFDKPEPSLVAKANELGIEVIEFKELENIGQRVTKPQPEQPPKPEDTATICYTSGTSGMPKGVVLTHRNVVADLTALHHIKRGTPTKDDVMVSYLPLAHMFERIMETLMYSCGAKVGFYRGDIKLIVEDLQELKPTIMPTVPRLLNRVYDKVMSEVNKSFIKRLIFPFAMERKLAEVRQCIIRNNSIWDILFFSKIRNSMGGRLRLLLCGSAPLSEEVMNFCRATMGCIVVEGYGQTECVAGATLTYEGDSIPCQVGPPIACCKIKMVDVPDMNYFAKKNCGEVCIKGPHVMKGYYKNTEATAEALDADGWLHTGDIGQWTEEGTLKLIDRKKHIFKLSQGEYIVPEKIEMFYNRSQYVAQCFIYGDSLKSFLVGVVVPNAETLTPAVQKELGITGTIQELCNNDLVKKFVLKDMCSAGHKNGLASFEQVKIIHLHPDQFTVESGFLTPTFKTKRNVLKQYFKSQIDHMYALCPQPN